MTSPMASDLTTENVAWALGEFYRVPHYAFREAVGVSAYCYLLMETLHTASRYLKSGSALISEACLSHGFAVPSRLSRQFERLLGEPPSGNINNK